VKILAGPQNWQYFTENFQLGLEDHDLRVFKYAEDEHSLSLSWPDTFQDLQSRLPDDWEPDWVVWWLPEYLRIMPGIEECPYPTLLVISDWNVASEPLYRMVEAFDVVATDAMGVQRLRSYGAKVPVFQAPLYGFVPGVHRLLEDCPRDIPVGYVGNTNGLVYRDRMQTLATACQGLGRKQVVVASGVFGEDYVKVLNRCKITLNHSLRGELNMRSFETMACGSLLFCEDTNLESGQYFRDGEHLVLFNQDNLVDRLKYYLDRPDELAEIARNGYERVQEFTYQKQWTRLIQKAQEVFRERPRPFTLLDQEERDRRYADYCYSVFSPTAMSASLQAIEKVSEKYGDDDFFKNLLGCSQAYLADFSGFGEREDLLRRAVQNLSQVKGLGLLPRLSLARVLANLGRSDEAAALIKQALDDDLPTEHVCYYPRLMHPLALLWERETDAKSRKDAVMWLAHDLLSALDQPHRVEHGRRALTYRSDQPTTWVRLSRCEELSVEERTEALGETIKWAPFLLEAHLLRLELASARLEEYDHWYHDATTMIQTLAGSDFQVVKKQLKDRLRSALSGKPNDSPPESLGEFANQIQFKFCPPEVGVNNLFLWEPTKSIELLNTAFPVDDKAIKERLAPIADVPRMSTLAVAAIINRAVEQMPEGQAYLNVGVWNGYSFLAALLGNPDKLCIGVDNFSQFGGPVDDFLKRYDTFRGPAHSFHDQDYEEYLRIRHKGPLGVYFYDGEHSYKNQFTGLKAAEKFFAPGCLILVDDTNWDDPRNATLDFIGQSRHRYRVLLDARTPYSGHPTWWNGLMLLEHLGPIRKKRRRK
jgi:tetratricopeptide (TPR) repeat protein